MGCESRTRAYTIATNVSFERELCRSACPSQMLVVPYGFMGVSNFPRRNWLFIMTTCLPQKHWWAHNMNFYIVVCIRHKVHHASLTIAASASDILTQRCLCHDALA